VSDDDIQARLVEIEDRIEHLQDAIESCRKGILASRSAIVLGSLVFLLNLAVSARPSLIIALSAFTATIAGLVWLGANKTSREQAFTALRLAQSEWQEVTDAIDMSTIGE
jgi:hypothetical protein